MVEVDPRACLAIGGLGAVITAGTGFLIFSSELIWRGKIVEMAFSLSAVESAFLVALVWLRVLEKLLGVLKLLAACWLIADNYLAVVAMEPLSEEPEGATLLAPADYLRMGDGLN